MIDRRQALRGGMPLYKWVGNQVLTAFENRLLGANLSEFHTGFRAYSVHALAKIPFAFNTDGFHFDTEIIIQGLATGWRIKEVSIPSHYGDEVCYVNGFRYAKDCMASVLRYRLTGLGLFYERNFDFGLFEEDNYQFKISPHSLHQYVLKRVELSASTVSLELGANHGLLSSRIASRVRRHVAVDLTAPDRAGASEALAIDLNGEFARRLPDRQYDCCVALDVIEHLDSPEEFLLQLGSVIKTGGKVYLSTGNITYVLMRLALLLGQFNYGKRGILDRTHKKLFGVRSFAHLLRQYGYRVDEVRGFPPPLTDLVSDRHMMKLVESVHAWLARLMPRLFAYNFLVVATRQDSINQIFAMTVAASSEKSPAHSEQPQKREGATSA
jgi:SAM-dependent methyltransferase